MGIKKPNVFIVGVPKSGKVTIRYWLSQHPDVYACMFDTDFFAKDVEGNQCDRVNTEEKYLQYFKGSEGKKIVLDQVSRSSVSNVAAKLIKEFDPNAKIIVSIRNPADQMFSWHHTLRKIGFETEPSFYKAAKMEKARKAKTRPGFIKNYFYREFADYYPQIKRYVDLFGKKNVKVVLFDELGKRDEIDKKEKVYKDLLKFLGLKNAKVDLSQSSSGRSQLVPKNEFVVKVMNFFLTLPRPLRLFVKSAISPKLIRLLKSKTWKKTKEKSKIDPEVKNKINKSFEKNLKKLEKLIDKDLSPWYDPKIKSKS